MRGNFRSASFSPQLGQPIAFVYWSVIPWLIPAFNEIPEMLFPSLFRYCRPRPFPFKAISARYPRVSATSRTSSSHLSYWTPLASNLQSQLLVLSNNRAPIGYRAYASSQGDRPNETLDSHSSPRQQTPPPDPPPLPIQPVNIPGPPATFSLTNNPSLDAALTTVIGLGLGKWTSRHLT